MVSHAFDGRILVIRAEGIYTSGDLQAAFEAALGDPEFPPNARLLLDVRGSLNNPSVAEVELRLALMKGLRPHVEQVCAVVVSDPLRWRIAHSYRAHSEHHRGPRIEVFKDVRAAKDWLVLA